MKLAALLLAVFVLFAVPSQQTAKNYSGLTIAQLIDDLTTIDSSGVGYHPTASTSAFVAEDTPPRFRGGVLGSREPTIHPAFRELVKRGAASLPELIKGLSDKRETKLKVGGDFFMFQCFSNEYDLKQRTSGKPNNQGTWDAIKERGFSGQYTVKVGDICYAAIG